MKEHHRIQIRQSLPEEDALRSFPHHNDTSHRFLLQIPIKLANVQYYRHVLHVGANIGFAV